VTVIRSQVVGCGSFLPDNVVSNSDLAKKIDTSDEWIRERTGILRRHIARQGETTSDLAVQASRAALLDAGMDAGELDMIVCATTTPDETFPSVATKVQARLGMSRGAAFDVQAVCAGFLYAISVADNFIKSGQAKTVLVIGAETMSRLMDWTDRTTCVLFGDGAGAIILQASIGEGTSADRGVLTTHIQSDGRLHDLLYVDGGPSTTQTTGFLRMHGKEVFKHAVTHMAGIISETAAAASVPVSDIDWIVPHQANQRILDATAKKLHMANDKVVSTIAEHGNTSAASVPLALVQAVGDGRIKKNDLVLLEAIGGGLAWGAALVRW
jgi:3-oxoacyl-[acyl-carrier-protein] synthase-3